jgi:type I restriction enzyme M protein
VAELEEKGVSITGKEQTKLDAYRAGKAGYEAVIEALRANMSDKKWMSPEAFQPVLEKVLAGTVADSKLISKIMDGLSVMDKEAEIQVEKKGKNKGEIIYDKDTKDTEIVRWDDTIDDYMAREVLPHVPDAKWFWEEKLDGSKPVIRTGAEIPFTRYFYKYQQPTPSEELERQFLELEASVSERIKKLFGR